MKSIDPAKTARPLIAFIKDVFRNEKYTNAVIGVSGGIDSATSLTLTVGALGRNNVYPVLLPYGSLNDQGTKDARVVIDWLGIPKKNVRTVPIKPMADAAELVLDSTMMEAGRKGNVMARMRMVVLYDFAKAMPAMVVGTENKTEHLLGYYTRFGDEASDVEPLRHLYKTHVYELARYLGIPKKILTKPPTAGLWEGQTDEGEFGFTYKDADTILSLFIDEHKTKKQIVAMGFNKDIIERMWWWIDKGALKARLPYCIKK